MQFTSGRDKKVLFAVGGTGGHLFPAQALAEELLEKGSIEVIFAGADLRTNRFLDRARFRFKDVKSATPFRRNPVRACLLLLKGIRESLRLLKEEKPDLIIGFGSYHSFPLLAAAKWMRIPFVLFEADTIPGKVNRLFSKYALFTAVHFPQAKEHLTGKSLPVPMPSKHFKLGGSVTCAQARALLGLAPECFTLFVFGGSQGARGINKYMERLLSLLHEAHIAVQLIHITGHEETTYRIKSLCDSLGIKCYVRDFEPHMGYLWKAATLLIGRSGASTLSEMLHFEVPGILIPYPHASDSHQHVNALFLEKQAQGGVCMLEEEVTADALLKMLCQCEKKLASYKLSMRAYKETQNSHSLGKIVYDLL